MNLYFNVFDSLLYNNLSFLFRRRRGSNSPFKKIGLHELEFNSYGCILFAPRRKTSTLAITTIYVEAVELVTKCET